MKNTFLALALISVSSIAAAQNNLGINEEHMPDYTKNTTDSTVNKPVIKKSTADIPAINNTDYYADKTPAEFILMILGGKPAYWYLTRMKVVSK